MKGNEVMNQHFYCPCCGKELTSWGCYDGDMSDKGELINYMEGTCKSCNKVWQWSNIYTLTKVTEMVEEIDE